MFIESATNSTTKALSDSAGGRENSFDLLAQASSEGPRVNPVETHRRLLSEMKRAADALGFSPGQVLSDVGRRFNPDAPMHPRTALAMMMSAYEEGVQRLEAGDPRVSPAQLRELSNAVNGQLLQIQNGQAQNQVQLAQFGAGVADFVRSSSVGMAGAMAMKVGGLPAGALVGGLTSLGTINAMALSAMAQGLPLEQLDIPRTLTNDVGNLLTTLGSPHLLAFFSLPAAPTANTMRAIIMHMVRQGGADAAIDTLFVAFTEAAIHKQPIPDALRAGAVQGVFSFLTTAGISGVVAGMDASKTRNFARMITALDDNDASRLMSQFGPEQARALREANPEVYRALNGRTDGALDAMLGNNPRGGAARAEVELVEIRPGEFVRSDTLAARTNPGGGLETNPRSTPQPDSGAASLNRRPALLPSAGTGSSAPPAGASGSGNGEMVRLGGEAFTINQRGDTLAVTTSQGQSFALPEGVRPEEAGAFLQGLYLNGALPGVQPPRHPVTLGGQDFAIRGAEGIYAVETPRGQIKTYPRPVATLGEAEQVLREAWLTGSFEGFGPPRTQLALGSQPFAVAGEPGGPFILFRAGGEPLMRFEAATAEEAMHEAGQIWLRGQLAGIEPPVSRLTLDSDSGQVVTIIGGGRGPFALGDRDGRYITDLATRGSNAVTSLEQASDMVKEAWGSGLLDSFGLPGPRSAPASAAASPSVSGPGRAATSGGAMSPIEPSAAPARAGGAGGLATAEALDPTDVDAVLKFTRDGWSDALADLPHQTREQMITTVRGEIARASDDWQTAPLEQALRVLEANRPYPDPTNVFAVADFVEKYWPDQLAELVPPAVLDEMTSTLWHAARSTDPSVRWDRNRIVRAMSTLQEAGGQAFPKPGDLLFGSGFAPEVRSADFGVREGAEYLGPDTRGNPVFGTPDGRRVGPFYETAMQLADEAMLDKPKTALSTFDWFRQYADVRVGAGISLTDQITGDPAARGAAIVGLDTFKTFYDETRPRAENEPTPAMRDVITKAFGISVRVGENISDNQISRRFVFGGFGTNSALQFKTASLNAAAVDNLRGETSPFSFRPLREGGVELGEQGNVIVRGRLALNVEEVPAQMDVFGSDHGRKFRLENDLTIDKTLKEVYVPILGEYREESGAKFVLPAGSVLPEEFVQMVNARVGDPLIEVSMPGAFERTAEGLAAAEEEVQRALNGGGSFIRDVPAEEVEAKFIGGFAQRISSVPGKPLEGANNLDVNFRVFENGPFRGMQWLQERFGLSPDILPVPRNVPGVADVVGAMRNNDLHGWNDKVRWKFNLPFRADVGPVKIRTAAYALREAQPDMRTHLMTSNEMARLGFSNELGHPRELDVPTWLATMVSADAAPGQIEAELGLARFPAGGIVVPPGGVDSLRSFLGDSFQDGTPGQREAIRTFLEMKLDGAGGAIRDTATLMPEDRDELIQLLYMIAEPVD